MTSFLRKRWFLLLICTGFLIAGLRPEWLRWTRPLDPRIVIAVALFLSAWTLQSRSLLHSLIRPGPALWAVAVSYGLLPAFAWLLGHLLPGEDLRIGLMISAAVPCTLASALLWTRMAGGNEGTALLATLLTTATSWLATTAWLVWTTATAVQIDARGMMGGLFLILVLPVGVGQLARAVPLLAETATRYRPAIGAVAQVLVFLIMMKAAVAVRDRFDSEAPLTGLALGITATLCIGTHLAALAGGYYGGGWLGFDRANRIAVAFACSQKTLPVSLFLFEVYYQDYPLAVVAMVFYHVGQLVVDTFIADGFRFRADEFAETGGLPLET